jgi:glutamate N-acetyltransferase/amino-acid N-acetyltransferase
MAEATAQALTGQGNTCLPEEVLVASTGVIGVPLPIGTVLGGIPQLVQGLGDDQAAALRAAEGILTTDSGVKQIAVRVDIDGTPVTIGAMAKGSGMIHPNMATMLSFIATDADIAPEVLQVALRESVDETYHMISVDGDTSTNDMVVLLANGQAGNPAITSRNQPSYEAFRAALHAVNRTLAEAIAKDGEGASKFLTAQVTEAASKSHARALAKAIVSSTLVKAAFYGADANWGRIVSAMGATGVPFEPGQISLTLASAAGSLCLLEHGEPVPFDEAHGLRVLAERSIDIRVNLHAGASEATAWGCDLTHDYVTVNSSYRS